MYYSAHMNMSQLVLVVYIWGNSITYLITAGFCDIAPDQLGTNLFIV